MLAVHRGYEQALDRIARVAQLRNESPAERTLITGLWYRCSAFCRLKKMKSNEHLRIQMRTRTRVVGWVRAQSNCSSIARGTGGPEGHACQAT